MNIARATQLHFIGLTYNIYIMKKLLFLLYMLLACTAVKAQVKSSTIAQDDEVYNQVDKAPSFPGGYQAMASFLSEKLVYPPVAVENKIQGIVFVTFVIRKDGSITDVKVLRSVDPFLDKEAVRVVSLMPKWEPAKKNGKNVSSYFKIPITFRL